MHPEINLKDFKLIVSDLDGTIKDSDQPIHPDTIKTFRKIHDLGISFTLASGRGLMSLRPFAEELEVSVPLVLANGCIIQSLDGQIHHRETMPTEDHPQSIRDHGQGKRRYGRVHGRPTFHQENDTEY